MDTTKVCLFGLGEAGSLLATDLLSAGAEVAAYDPAEVTTPKGVKRRLHPALAVRHADVVMAVTAEADAKLAFLQALEAVPADALYADLSTSSPRLKLELSDLAAKNDVSFADVALMSMVPGAGLATPSLAAGPGAAKYAATMNEFGGQVEAVAGVAGTASAKKLLRSVMMKGTAAVLIEAVRAGAAADDLDWLWENLSTEMNGADEDWMRRLITGSKTHARRRLNEMTAAKTLLDHLDVPSPMTQATVQSLRSLQDGELPSLPGDLPSDEAP